MEVQPELSTSPVVENSPKPIYTPTLNYHNYIFYGEPANTTEELLEAAHQRTEDLEEALNKQTVYVTIFGKHGLKKFALECISTHFGCITMHSNVRQ